ncbi:MAG: hypothetical protein IKP36_02425 [Bacteroidaceae bacterium]|nr:hypothetical protein [Bacteroidaceae bacterium]
MKKFLLLMTAALLLAANTQARVITPTKEQVWWGYFNESDFETADYTIGTGSAMTLMAGIYIPANHTNLGNATIQGVRVYIDGGVTSSLSNLKIWISKKLPNKLDEADYKQSTLGSLSAGINDYKLTTPYQVNNEGFYIGYSVKSTTGYFIRCGGTDAPNSFFVGNPDAGMSWSDLNGQGLGKLAFQILVEGGNFPSNCVTAEDFGQHMVLQGEETSVPITITNYGQNTIGTISYTIATEGGSTTPEETVSVGSLALNGTKTINIPFASDAETRKYQKTFNITKVDGKNNTASENSATGFLITMKEKYAVTPVIEEFTGTWCGWCPRGTVGMEKIHETYGDQVVQIAAHSGDVMAISAYSSVINTYAGGFPSSITDRRYEADPSFASLKNVLTTAFNRAAPASIDLYAEWDNTTKTKVVFTATTRFAYNENDGQYGIAYILVEDGLTGTGSNWAQTNYYSGQSVGGDMAWWCSAGSSVTGIEFNHVAVAGWSVQNGVNNSVNPIIDSNTEQTHTYTGSISGNSLVQDKTKLKAVALLIDRTNGTIVNAAQTAIEDYGTGISTVSSKEDTPEARYSLDGRKLQTPQKGINIIRMSDGTTRKVLIK